jgi:GNAT superfamily N-acetyltransferase
MLVLASLDDSTIEEAGALVAGEHVAARRIRPELPVAFADADACARALQALQDAGHTGLVTRDGGRLIALMTVTVRENRVIGKYARFPAEGFAVDPEVDDPTGAVGALYAEMAPSLVAGGARYHYLLHSPSPGLDEALSNLGFGRDGCYGVQRVAHRHRARGVRVFEAGEVDLDTIARLALVEIEHRATSPMFARRAAPSLDDLANEHRALRSAGAVHLIAELDGRHVGLLTIEPTSPAPRLCPAGQPYIGSTATLPDVRRRGVGSALVDAALGWAHEHGFEWISVDFATANPLSRPFWLGAGFRPTGYGVLRLIDQTTARGGPQGRPAAVPLEGNLEDSGEQASRHDR